MLQQAGFHVHRFPPIPKEDAEVGRWAAQYRRDDDPKDSSPHSAISLSLSHLSLWRSFPSQGEWLWIFEDDVSLNPRGVSRLPPPLGRGNRGSGVEIWRWPDPPWPQVRCLVALAARMASAPEYQAVPIIYLGTARTARHHRSHLRRLVGNHTLRMCETLRLHAYGVRRGLADALADQVLRRRNETWRFNHALYRFNLDVMLRGFFMADLWRPPVGRRGAQTGSTQKLMPLCVDMEEKGIMVQGLAKAPENSTSWDGVKHTRTGKLAW